MLGEPAKFYKAAGEVLERVRNADKLPNVNEILIAGQREAKMAADRVKAGSVPLEKNMLAELRVLAKNYEAMDPAAAAAYSVGVGGGGGGGGSAQTNALLEKLLNRIDRLESQVQATSVQQQQLGKQQQRLETVTVESMRNNNFGGR